MGIKNKASWISNSFKTEKRTGKSFFTIGGVSIDEVSKHILPPYYIYDTKTIKEKFTRLQKVFAPYNFLIYYAVKPNSALAIVDELYQLGAGLDVASLGELLIAQKIGVEGEKVSFAGPVKNDEALRFAIEYGVHIINAESEDELQRINVIAGERKVKQRVALRINIKQSIKNASHLIMAGEVSKFGIDEEQITDTFIKRIQSLSNLNLSGIHVYSANMLNAETFLENVENICNVAQRLNHYFTIKSIDFGGGLAVPYSENEEQFQLKKITDRLGGVLSQFHFIKKNKVALSIEPGRYLVAQCGIYVSKVENIKISRGEKYILVDGGIHHFIRPSLVDSIHPVYNLSRINDKSEEPTILGGALCTPIDLLGKDVLLPKETKRGDLIGVFIAGAYGWSESMQYFMSMQTAAEVLVHNKKFYLIRPAEHPLTFLKNQIIPNGIVY